LGGKALRGFDYDRSKLPSLIPVRVRAQGSAERREKAIKVDFSNWEKNLA
jgi:hypothetical protein